MHDSQKLLDTSDLSPRATDTQQSASAGWSQVSAPGDDLPAALSGTLAPETIVKALQDMERVTEDHVNWLRAILTDLFMRLNREQEPGTPIPVFDDRLWRSGHHHIVLKGTAGLADIGNRIAALAPAAEHLAILADTSGQIATSEIERFMTLTTEVDLGMRRILCDIWNRLANIDPLTGLGNRPAMLQRLGIECERHARSGQPCCVAILDIDHFKMVNDTHGHVVGDMVLRSIASLLAASLRPYDAVFRYGGEEFVLCLPNADPRTAWAISERLRLKVANWTIPAHNKGEIHTTISIGIAPMRPDPGVEVALEQADSALYAAKHNGRNTIFVDGA